jgi:hypothetical protein
VSTIEELLERKSSNLCVNVRLFRDLAPRVWKFKARKMINRMGGLCCVDFLNPICLVAGVRIRGLIPTEYVPPEDAERIQSLKRRI